MSAETTVSPEHLKTLVADVAAAYFANTHVAPADIPTVINEIARSLAAVREAPAAAVAAAERPMLTSSQVRKSITPEALISFEDGRPYKTLKRHLSVRGLTVDAYRAKWGLPADYPMVASAYSAARSLVAKSLGLGQRLAQARAGTAGRARGAKAGRGRRAKPPAPEAAS